MQDEPKDCTGMKLQRGEATKCPHVYRHDCDFLRGNQELETKKVQQEFMNGNMVGTTIIHRQHH